MASGSPEKRFWMKVDRRGPDECWLWTAKSVTRGGYGSFRVSPGKLMRSHRYAYELLIGPIPDGLTLHHLCETGACVNPAHLTPVSLEENSRLGSAALRTSWDRRREAEFCGSGIHRFTPENTGRDYRGRRFCKACGNASARKRRTPRPTCKYGHPYEERWTQPGKHRRCKVCHPDRDAEAA